MNRGSETMVMFDSPEAAQPHTMEGWKSRDGYFYAEESMARYAGCTHRPCQKCGTPTAKHWLWCHSCRAKADEERYWAMPVAEWDGVSMVYSQTRDRFYSDPGAAEDDADDDDVTLGDLRLVLCVPQYAPTLETDYFEDVIPDEEYGDVPDELLEAIDAFNAALKGRVLSWTPGKFRLADAPHA